jgi:hypothetical protein
MKRRELLKKTAALGFMAAMSLSLSFCNGPGLAWRQIR